MNETTCYPGYEEGVVDLEFYGVFEGLRGCFEHFVEFGGLADCSWETVEDEAFVCQIIDRVLQFVQTHPFLHSAFVSNWFLIMLIMMSSLTSPPASIIFFASRPRGVFLETCSRNMSPVAYIA